MLAKPNNVEFKNGAIERLFCSVCGDEIAGMTEGPIGSGPNASKLVMRFKRFYNYAEAKFRHSDGNFHVTNGCRKCIMAMSLETAQEVYEADMAVMDMPAGKSVVAIVAVDTSGSGLL